MHEKRAAQKVDQTTFWAALSDTMRLLSIKLIRRFLSDQMTLNHCPLHLEMFIQQDKIGIKTC